jgi:hypothetical protein
MPSEAATTQRPNFFVGGLDIPEEFVHVEWPLGQIDRWGPVVRVLTRDGGRRRQETRVAPGSSRSSLGPDSEPRSAATPGAPAAILQ